MLRPERRVPPGDSDFCLHVLHTLQEYQTAPVAEILIDRADLAAKRAVDGHSQRSGLSVHRTAPTDHQIGVPNQIQTVHDLVWDAYLPISEKAGPMTSQMNSLLLIARKNHDLYLGPAA